ncbi:lipase secretion chaperone [Pseudomonas flexibilis]|uniref:Lipase chaperone n=1 Tax=Pseudomonas flexibilis TaxID=706570 RepID=A0A0B3BYY0_9PSED|nr:lipase secretion chaperone [Pseudomonas flexibilis]KHO65894.1 hypothetical protein PT85_07625 [Pseudomonas flexibilis]SCX75403.1 lipase chaperone protein [Pseudomonas flexibilis]
MKKLLLALGLVLMFAFGGLHLLPNETTAQQLRPLNAEETRAWERRLRAYNRAKARIQLNERLDSNARQQAIEQLQIDYFDDVERTRLRQRDRQQHVPDL